MKERPILFSAPMVRAILDDRKGQTRRIMKPQPHAGVRMSPFVSSGLEDGHGRELRCPHGKPGDRLWVRETFCPIYPQDPTYNGGEPIEYDYAATYQHGDRLSDALGVKKVWKPSIHMPRKASRIILEITGVRVERLQDISEADAIAEGIDRVDNNFGNGAAYCDYRMARPEDTAEWFNSPVRSFQTLWEQINGPGSWDTNPWVWVVEFRRIT